MVVLPSSPVWYQSRGIDTSYNGIFAFGSRNLIYLFDLKKKRSDIYGILSGHTEKVTSCSFCSSSDKDQSLRLVSGGDDCSVKVWDIYRKFLLLEHSVHGSNKIISVQWNPVKQNLVLSGDEKGYVVCWDVEKNVTNLFCPDGTSQMQLQCLTCSPHESNIAAIGYKSGAVSIIDINKDGMVVKKLRGHTNEIHSIVWSQHDESTTLQDMAIDSELNNETSLTNGNTNDPFGVIATGSKDRTIKLWRVSKGKCIRTFKIPNKLSKGRRMNDDASRLYVSLYWPRHLQSRFLSAGYNGDILLWNMCSGHDNYETLTNSSHDTGHQRIVFNISHGATQNSFVSTSMDRQLIHWTLSQDSSKTSSVLDWALSTLGGFAYSISISPKDPSTVAVGVGDGMIRLWKTRNPRTAYDITTLWQGIKEKVMALEWHPDKIGCLAFATEDGKVGIYDTLSLRPPSLAETYHLKAVYSISWGPRCFPLNPKMSFSEDTRVSPKTQIHLFSSGGDGVIYQHNPDKMSSDAINIDSIISSTNQDDSLRGKHSDVSWNQTGQFLAIGNDNGTINIFTAPHLKLVMSIKSHTKIINCIKWRPINEHDQDVKHLEIASGSNSSVLHVHNLTSLLSEKNYNSGDSSDHQLEILKTAHHSLIGHLSRITDLSYNPKNPDQIVSSSYDGTAQVWDIKTETALFNFRGHYGRLMCVAWSPISFDMDSEIEKPSGMIYSGSDDYTVHGWFAEDQQHKEPVKVLQDFGFGAKRFQSKKKSRNKKTTIVNVRTETDSTPTLLSPDLEHLLEKKKAELLETVDCSETFEVNRKFISNENDITCDADLTRFNISSTSKQEERDKMQKEDSFSMKKRKRLKNMFAKSVHLDNRNKSHHHQDCIKIARWKLKDQQNAETEPLTFLPGIDEDIHLGLYTDRRSAFRMMMAEKKDEQEKHFFLSTWMGDVCDALEKAAATGELTDQMVAMAPMAGQKFWHKMCHAFALQLISQEHIMHGVHYLLACDKVNEALDTLLEKKHYREAVALARVRLCDNDPNLKRTIMVWADKLKKGGAMELAAKCLLSVGEFESAATCLAQRASSGSSSVTDGNVSSLWAAASLCELTNDMKYFNEFASRAMHTVCLRTWNWLETTKIVTSFDNLQPYKLILVVHETLISRLVTKTETNCLPTVEKSEWNIPVQSPDTPSFLSTILQAWKLLNKNDMKFNPEMCKVITDMAMEKQLHEDNMNELRVLFQASVCLAAAVVSLPLMCKEHVSSGSMQSTCSSTQDNLVMETGLAHYLINVLDLMLSNERKATQITEVLQIICEIVFEVNTNVYDNTNSERIETLTSMCVNKLEFSPANSEIDITSTKQNVLLSQGVKFLLKSNSCKSRRLVIKFLVSFLKKSLN